MVAKLTDYGTNVAGLQRKLRALPKDATAELRDASVAIAEAVAADARTRAFGVGRSYSLVAHTIRATRDRVPVIAIGGSQRIPGRQGDRQTVGDVMWGSEFGGQGRPTTMQFLPHLGQTGYALWPTVRERSEETAEAYGQALDDALAKGGPG